MSLSVTPDLIIAAAQKRGWSAHVIDEAYGFYKLELPDGRYYYLKNARSIKSHEINGFIADQKDLFYRLAAGLAIPVPATLEYGGEFEAARAFLAEHHRVVVKPYDQSHGNGVTVGVTDESGLREALSYSHQYSPTALIQQHIEGDDYRVLIIDGRLAAAAKRKPAYVVGDGKQTVAELIEQENANGQRAAGYTSLLTQIDSEAARRYLGGALHNVPAEGSEVRVVGTANIGRGGVAIDVTDTVDPSLVTMAQKIAQHFDMGICGVDFLVTSEGSLYVIELNARPSLGLHEYPFQGKPRNTPDVFLDWLSKE